MEIYETDTVREMKKFFAENDHPLPETLGETLTCLLVYFDEEDDLWKYFTPSEKEDELLEKFENRITS